MKKYRPSKKRIFGKWNTVFLVFKTKIGFLVNFDSKMYGAEPQYNDLWYNNIPGLTMGMSLTEHKIFPVITIKSISQTTGNANTVKQNKLILRK